MEQFLHASSHHFPAEKFGVLCTLSTQALRISHDNQLESQNSHLLDVFENNGYSRAQGLKSFQKAYKGLRWNLIRRVYPNHSGESIDR